MTSGHEPTATVLALEAMLAAHPDAFVGAVDAGARYVPMPAAVPVTGHRLLRGHWPLELFAASERVKLGEAWRARLHQGVVSAEAVLLSGSRASVHIYDVSAELGADIVVLLGDPDAIDAAAGAPAVPPAPRFCRIIRDELGMTVEIDDAAPRVLGHPVEALLSRQPAIERVHPDDRAIVMDQWLATLANPGEAHRARARALRADGSYTWFEITTFNRLDDPDRPHVLTEMLDVSAEMAAHEAVAAREQLLHRLAEALPLGVLQVGVDRSVVYRNETLDDILGVDRVATMDEQFAAVVPEDRRLLEKAFAVALVDGSDDDVVVRITGVRPGEQVIRVITKSLHAGSGEVSGVIACVTDVTEATLMGRELERRATFDALTGCFNRVAILGRLASALADGGFDVAVLFLDLDGFKEVNDRLGHAAGDDHLRSMARVLGHVIRPSDVVGRLGGDEFLVVCQDIRDTAGALGLAGRVADALQAASLRASIGVAWAAAGTIDADHLVHLADEAMYESKREAQGRPHLAAS